MKRIITLAVATAALVTAQAQERLPREESLKYAFILTANLKDMLNTPIPTDPDVKRPVAMKDEGYGAMVLPESKLTAETLGKAGPEAMALGQLWMVKLAPLADGQVVPASKLRTVHISSGDQEADVTCCTLGARKNSEGTLDLLIYGKSREPVMTVAMKSISGAQENPIEMGAEKNDQGALVTLKFTGKYEARFMVTDPEKY